MTHPKSAYLLATVVLVLLVASAAPAFAFNSDSSSTDSSSAARPTSAPAAPPSMAAIQADINASDWVKAIADLKLFIEVDTKNADAWNLLGYSYRQHGDLDLADTAYDRALKLNPNHIDALSYQGILYVKLNKLDEAKANLAKIEAICGNTTCPQYVALAQALG
jgi:Flp pilus assembly protein TadD